jgi:hypothetical protein
MSNRIIGGKNKVVTIYSPHGRCKDRERVIDDRERPEFNTIAPA